MRSGHYRPDIDGLRAIAVLSVVFFHALPGHLLGGFAGVDIFFVISGYLITGDLHRRSINNTFSITDFYIRRIRRIFPALIFVIFSVILVGAITLSSYDFAQTGKEIAASAAFSANLYYWHSLNYFSSEAITKPLLHLWSLGVEEQFYLVWPIFIYILSNKRSNIIRYTLLLTATSFAFSVYAITVDPAEAFFSPVSRFWELALGGALALYAPEFRKRTRTFLSCAGLVGVFSSILIVRETGFPGYQAILPVLSTVALIAAGPSAIANRLLATRAPAAIGLISYPLYLWHWPILSFDYIVNGYTYGSAIHRLALMGVAAILATVTYWIVERRGRTARPAILLLGMAALGMCGVTTYAASGWPRRPAATDPANALIGQYRALHQEGLSSAYLEKCDFLTWKQQSARESIHPSCTAAPYSKPVWMLWGDSHAQALSQGLRQSLPPGTSFVQVATSACTPDWPDASKTHQAVGAVGVACSRSNSLATSTIAQVRPDVLILSMNEGYLSRDWNAFARQARTLGAKRIVLVGPVPQYDPSLPVLMARALPAKPAIIDTLPGPIMIDTKLKQENSINFEYISPMTLLCAGTHCRTTVGTFLIAVDGSHLSPAASSYVGRYIADKIKAGTRNRPYQP